MLVDSEKVRRLIVDVAESEVMPRFEKLEAGDISEKGPGDFVTVADVASEQRLTPALRDLLPGSLVVGEEAVSTRSTAPPISPPASRCSPSWLR